MPEINERPQSAHRGRKRLRCGVCNTVLRQDRFDKHFEKAHSAQGWSKPFTPLADDDLSVAELFSAVRKGESLLYRGRNFATVAADIKTKFDASRIWEQP